MQYLLLHCFLKTPDFQQYSMKVHDLSKNYFSIKNDNEDYIETKLFVI